jgi:hypothetical protein
VYIVADVVMGLESRTTEVKGRSRGWIRRKATMKVSYKRVVEKLRPEM